MTVMRQETFGPTLPVVKVADEDEAIQLANDSNYGLSATVWTGDYARGERIARRLDAGGVNINDMMSNLFSFALPMAGWKSSGIGSRNGGAHGLLKYCRPQAITTPPATGAGQRGDVVPVLAAESPARNGHHAGGRRAHGLQRVGIKPRERIAMKCKAAVLRGVGRDWEIEEITLDPPRDGEVLVKMAVAGVCHSDDHYTTGDGVMSPELTAIVEATGGTAPEYFPLLGGHEGAGVVEEVGPGVRSVRPGDHVATSFIPACGACRWCVSGMTYLCDAGAMMFAKEMTTDGTRRRHLGDEDLTAMTQLGTFSEYMVVAEESVIKIDDSIPFEAASLVSCGVTTGWGSATVGVGTQPGDTVVIVGTGGVGINAVQGARAAGANAVVAVDPVEFKRDTAKFFGATDTSPSVEEAIPLVRELTNGVMADRVVLTPSVLHAELVAPAMMLTRKGGTCLMTAVPKLEVNMVPLLLVDMLQGCKQLKGLLYGGMNPRASMPMLLSMYRSGNLKLDELVTHRYRLDQINDAITDMREGRNIRGIIEFD